MDINKILKKIKTRKKNTHKYDYGHVFVLAGSIGMTGAAFLTSRSAMRSGSGLVTLGIPESLNQIMEIKLTEEMTLPLPETLDISLGLNAYNKIKEFSKKTNVLAIGPGVSRNKKTAELIKKIVKNIDKDIVLDADGILVFSKNNDAEIFKKHKGVLIITPHEGEMAKLIGKTREFVSKNRKDIVLEFAQKYNVIVVLKGSKTIIACPEKKVYVNNTGNSGMASAGTGDVLTGIIASFLGQGLTGFESACLGSYLHGLAGDNAAKKKSCVSLIASDIIKEINFNNF